MTVRAREWQGWQSIEARWGSLRIALVPERGAKVVSLCHVPSGREWLYRDRRRPWRRCDIGDPFDLSGLAGWDECFPSVAAGRYPGDNAVHLADHGDVWSQPWQVTAEPLRLTASVAGSALPFTFTRIVEPVADDALRWSYQVHNADSRPLIHGWSAHPLLSVAGGLRVECASVRMWPEFTDGRRIQQADVERSVQWTWPSASSGGLTHDLSRIEPSAGVTDKVVLAASRTIRLVDNDDAAWLQFELDPGAIPYVGLCVNGGAWPDSDPQVWVAVEPTMAVADDLAASHRRGGFAEVPAGSTASWEFVTRFGPTEDAMLADPLPIGGVSR